MASERQPVLVQAIYSFKGKNNDELCFKKGDIITVTQMEEGGWWEGTFGDKTGWFPSNYVKEYRTQNSLSPVVPVALDLAAQQKVYRSVVLKDLIDSERAHVTELQGLLNNFLRPLESSDIIKAGEYQQLVGNLSEVVEVHERLLAGLEEAATRPAAEQRVGNLFLTLAPRLKQVHMTYCAGHPRAVCILDRYKQELGALMEANGAASPGLLVLTTGLSKPFRRLDKYAGMLTELERHVEEAHIDRGDTQRSVCVYKDIASACCVMRRQKEMELEVVSGGVRGWEGEDLSSLGDILHMGSVAVGPDHRDRYLVLFPTTLLMLSVSQRMSAFIYEGKLPLTGISINKLEDTENYKNAFEISGPMIERIVAVCQTREDQQAWVDSIRQQIRSVRVSSPAPSLRPQPPPPPHTSVSPTTTPYSRLTAYFARLVRKGLITRRLLKRLLYSEFLRVNTEFVCRRRRERRSHRVECVIYPQEAVRTWVTESGSESESNYSGRETKSEECTDRSVASSCLGYVRGPYRSTLTISRPVATGCSDLTQLDGSTTLPRTLGTHNSLRSHYQSLPTLDKPPYPEPSHSSVELAPSPTRVVEENTPDEERVRPLHRSYSYHFVQGKSSMSSHHSTDSGLADILASPELVTPAPEHSLPAGSEGSGNYEAQCLCSSPFGSTPRTSTTSTTTTPTYRTAMYAHWCLKMRIPAAAVKQPPDGQRK